MQKPWHLTLPCWSWVTFSSLAIVSLAPGYAWASDELASVAPALSERLDQIQSWAELCGNTAAKADCDVGDAVLFNGLLCLSGEALACDAVRLAQGPDGRWWRAEQRVGIEVSNAFSRDMALGVFAYLVTTRDTRAAVQWLQWIRSENGKLCPRATDLRCLVTPSLWGFFALVWDYLGLPLTPNMVVGRTLVSESLYQAAGSASPGYPLHLVAVQAHLAQHMRLHQGRWAQLAPLIARRQPENPYYLYLALGKTLPTASAALSQCPTSEPARRTQWAWERDTKEAAWKDSMGWDCIFLLNLLLRNQESV